LVQPLEAVNQMPKIKTHKGAKRRFHVTGTGKVVRTKGPKSHFRRNKAARVKRMLDKKIGVSKAMGKKIKAFLPS
jgi:large subunit ribosomal protein L35